MKRPIKWLMAGLFLLLLVLIHASFLIDAYGPGAPYYGRTTNMDKWTNPWPLLISMDVLLCGAWLVGCWLFRRQRK